MSAFLSTLEVVLEDGFIYAILAMGYYISYKILDFPDLSVEGTVLSGGVVFSLLVNQQVNPWLSMLTALVFGGIAGTVTGILHVKLKIRPLLCGILVSTALISVNLVLAVSGQGGDISGEGLSTVPIGRDTPTILRTFPLDLIPYNVGGVNLRKLIGFFLVAVVVKILIDLYLKSKNGMLLRATGDNEKFACMLGKDPGISKILGLAIGNGAAAFAGALIAQSRGNANQSMGLGMIIIGLASLIIGISVLGKVKFLKPTTMVIVGAVIYQACLGIASLLGVPSAYNKLIMALLFTTALVASGRFSGRKGVRA